MSSFKYNNVYIKNYESIVGPKESNSNIKFKNTIEDYYYNEKNIEDAEIKMQEFCLNKLTNKTNNIPLVIGGDLLNQITSTSYNLNNKNIPFLGIYNACATFNEGLIILSNFIESKLINNGIIKISITNCDD